MSKKIKKLRVLSGIKALIILEPYRKQVVVATKFGFDFSNYQKDASGRTTGLSSRPETIRSAVDGSLKRLRTDHIDIYYQHCVDLNVPIEEVADTIVELIKAGKDLHWWLSEASVKTIRRAHARNRFCAVQPPLGKAILTGRMGKNSKFDANDYRSQIPRFNPENFESNIALADYVGELAALKGATPAQIALG